jgi:hypothetical protein
MSSENRKQKLATISVNLLNNRAAQKAGLFDGLEIFVNAGDSDEEYRKIQMQIPNFWPLGLRGPVGPEGLDQPLEWPRDGQQLYRAFRDYLRRLWRSDFYNDDGSTRDSRYLEYLLGLETRYAVAPPAGFLDSTLPTQGFADGWLVLYKKHKGLYCVPSVSVAPSWKSAKFEYLCARDFQRGVYELLIESWRARLCRRCRKYFIADKAAQQHCSVACGNRSKTEIGLRYWHEKGAHRREARIRKKKKSERSGKSFIERKVNNKGVNQ